MKKLLLLLVLLCSTLVARAQLSTSVTNTVFCQGMATPVTVAFTDATTSYQVGNVFTTQLSDAAGSFAAPVVIGTLASASATGTVAAVVPASVAAGTGYRIRVVASDPATVGADNGTDLIVQATPSVPVLTTSPVCSGATLPVSVTNPLAGGTYNWTGPGGVIPSSSPTLSIPNATVADSGTYTAVATSAAGCVSAAGSVAGVVTSAPSAPLAYSNSPVCTGQTLQLSASAIAGATYSWSGPNFSHTDQNPVRPNAQQAHSGTYSVWASLNGCISPAGTTVVSVSPVPATPVLSSNSPVCQGTQLTLQAQGAAGATFNWTTPNNSGSYTGQTVTIPNAPASANDVWTATQTINGCTSAAGGVQVTVNPAPAAPVVTSNSPVCQGQTLTLSTLLVPGALYTWTAPSGASHLGHVLSITNAVAWVDSGQYTITTLSSNGCVSAPTVVNAIVAPQPPFPVIYSNSPLCSGQTLTLSTAPLAGASYNWNGPQGSYQTQAVTIPGATPVTPAYSGTYSLMVTSNYGCVSDLSTTQITVTPTPVTPVLSTNSPVCQGDTLRLFATGNWSSTATFSWTGPNGFGTTSQNPKRANAQPAYSGNYTLVVTDNGCSSQQQIINTTVTPATPPAFIYSSSTYCASYQGLATPVFSVPGTTAQFTSSPSGLAINPQTGEIDISTSAAGTYSVTATVPGTCATSFTAQVTLTNSASAQFSYQNSVYCQSDPNPEPVFSAGASPGLFTATPSGVTFENTNTGKINLAVSTPGTYTIINSIGSAGGCTATADTVTITILAVPATPTISGNLTACSGSALALTASGQPGNSFTWTGPGISGIYSGTALTVANATAQHAGLYTVQQVGTGSCSSLPTVVQVTVEAVVQVSVSGISQLIPGSTLFLNATPANNYTWSGPNNFTAIGSSVYIQNVTAAHSGNYIATSSGYCFSADTVAVQVLPANVISGTVFNDTNNNGVQDAGETPRPNQLVQLNNSSQFALTNANGAYQVSVSAGTFSVSLAGLNPYQIPSPQQHTVNFTGFGNSSTANNFGVHTQPIQDLRVWVYQISIPPVPGFNYSYSIKVKNEGSFAMSGQVRTILPAGLTFVSATTGASVSGDTLTWSFSSLVPGPQLTYMVHLQVPIGTALGSTILLQGIVTPIATDATPANNTANIYQTVVGSYDPNDKAVSPPGPISPTQVAAGQELVYKIRFQNTGTYLAFNILVADTLSPLLDVSTFKMQGTSHSCQVTLREQGILEFFFPNIMLPDSNSNEPLSHGYIQYSIKPKTTLALGDDIQNTAHIFFDFNEAIVTNTTSTVVALPNGFAEAKEESPLQVFPNPNNGNATVLFTSTNPAETKVSVLNLLGQEVQRLVQQTTAGEVEIAVDLQNQPAGIYLLQVRQGEKVYSAKVIRQ